LGSIIPPEPTLKVVVPEAILGKMKVALLAIPGML
jgi:hypothetical protein